MSNVISLLNERRTCTITGKVIKQPLVPFAGSQLFHQAACVENKDKVEFKCEEYNFVASIKDTLKRHMAKHENKPKNKKNKS